MTMYGQRMAPCRGCGKQIVWTKTTAGRPMPCDPELIRFHEEKGAPGSYVLPDGRVMRGTPCDTGEMAGYISHWATCPKQGQFRRK